MSDNEIIQRLCISKTTFYSNIRKLISLGAVAKIDGGYIINHRMFPSKDWDRIEEYKQQLDDMAEDDPSFPSSKAYRTFFQYYTDGFANLKMPLDEFLENLKAGLIYKKPSPQRKENGFEDMVYYF